MKTIILILTSIFSFTMIVPVLADDAHHPDKAKPAASAQVQKPAPEQTVKKMQGNVKKMQAQLDRVARAKNDAEVQGIMAEHMQTMEENMMLAEGMAGMDCSSMRSMGHHPMMGGGSGGMGMMGSQGNEPGAMMQRMQQLEQRMDKLEQSGSPAAPR